jgi:hypothetical protein
MMRGNWSRLIGVVVVLVAAFLLLAPVKANYIERVGSDFTVYRTASCGAPALSMLGSEPGLGGGSSYPIGGVNARQACKGAAGSRVSIGLLLLIIAVALLLTSRRSKVAVDTDDGRAVATV